MAPPMSIPTNFAFSCRRRTEASRTMAGACRGASPSPPAQGESIFQAAEVADVFAAHHEHDLFGQIAGVVSHAL